jgi:hypothetical protein
VEYPGYINLLLNHFVHKYIFPDIIALHRVNEWKEGKGMEEERGGSYDRERLEKEAQREVRQH